MLALEIQWLGSTYEAGLDGRRAEWPPHPARAFAALVSVAEPGSADDDALRWLEGQPRPSVCFPAAMTSIVRAYVPTNATGGGKGDTSQQYVARTNGERGWPRALPSVPRARVVWRDAHPPGETANRLSELARRVPYLGRATSPALLSFSADADEEAFEELAPSATGSTMLRTPYPGYLDALRSAHAGGQRATGADRSFGYSVPVAAAQERLRVRAAYPDLITLGFSPGNGIDGRHALAVAQAWKAAVLQRLGAPRPGDPWPALADDQLALLHGHHDGHRRQCSFLTLPFVDKAHATGYLIGVGLALSPDLGAEVRRAVLQLFGFDRDQAAGPRLTSLYVPGLAKFNLGAPDGRQTIDPQRWQEPASVWDSVLPIMLDRWPKRSKPMEDVIADGCVMAGYPRPREVELRRTSVVAGAPWVNRSHARRARPGPARPTTHAVLRFSQLVPGPVAVGHLRHLGLGLCTQRKAVGDG